jgi:hypothetical protein
MSNHLLHVSYDERDELSSQASGAEDFWKNHSDIVDSRDIADSATDAACAIHPGRNLQSPADFDSKRAWRGAISKVRTMNALASSALKNASADSPEATIDGPGTGAGEAHLLRHHKQMKEYTRRAQSAAAAAHEHYRDRDNVEAVQFRMQQALALHRQRTAGSRVKRIFRSIFG